MTNEENENTIRIMKNKVLRTKTNEKYFSEFVIDKAGAIKIKFAKKSVGLNQHARTWKSIDKKKFADLLGKRSITA